MSNQLTMWVKNRPFLQRISGTCMNLLDLYGAYQNSMAYNTKTCLHHPKALLLNAILCKREGTFIFII
jgi:hypothetical protein